MAISMLKIRRPLGRLIFNMGITIPGKTVFLIETAPKFQCVIKYQYFSNGDDYADVRNIIKTNVRQWHWFQLVMYEIKTEN